MPRLFFFAIVLRPPTSTLFPYTTLFRSIVFLDEPTSGLDPIGAGDFDELIRTLQQTLGLTVYMVTHDLDSLHEICDRIAVLSEGKVIVSGTIATMLQSEHPWVKEYFRGERGRAAISAQA